MNTPYHQIGNVELLVSVLLVSAMLILNYVEKTKLGKDIVVGTARCFAQLMLVGYVIQAIFNANKWYWVVLALVVMIVVGGVEAVRREKKKTPYAFYIATGSIALGTVAVMLITLVFIVKVRPWYNPQYLIPMTGMLIGNAMNGASLLINRMQGEISNNRRLIEAKLSMGAGPKKASHKHIRESIQAAMIPTINYLMIIGVVSLPGMMTGQIIAGASPLDSVRYQVAIMYMISAANAIAIYVSAMLAFRQYFTGADQLKEGMVKP